MCGWRLVVVVEPPCHHQPRSRQGAAMRSAGCIAMLLVAMAAGVSAQTNQKPKKFLGGPLVIEDQGSFFVGGVQKITEHAVVPPPPKPGAPPPPATPQQITIGQMYVQFQIPQ